MSEAADSPVKIVLVYQSLLGIYGDQGNAKILKKRLDWRGIPAEVLMIEPGEPLPSDGAVYLLGGGEDNAQTTAVRELKRDGHLFEALAQFERDLIRERTRAGLQAAEERGRRGGRQAVVTPEKLAKARQHLAAGLNVREAAARVKIGKTALYQALKAEKLAASTIK